MERSLRIERAARVRAEQAARHAKAAIATAEGRTFSDRESALHYLEQRDEPCVVKASGLAAGKGVIVCDNREEAIAAVEGVDQRSVPEVAWSPLTRLGLGSALRRLGDAGERCVVHRRDGGRHDGVPARVGQDFVEISEGHGAAARLSLVAFPAIAAVQSS